MTEEVDESSFIQSTLILGIGNVLHKDDGLGCHIVSEMISANLVPGDVDIMDGGTGGYDLLSDMTGRKKIIIVDALKSDDTPGSIYRFPAEHLKATTGQSYSQHDTGMDRVIQMLWLMGEQPEIEIIGIVPEDIQTLEIGLSESVRAAIPKAVEQILRAAAH